MRLALAPRGAPIATKKAALIMAEVVVSVVAEKGKNNLLHLELSRVDVDTIANDTTRED